MTTKSPLYDKVHNKAIRFQFSIGF